MYVDESGYVTVFAFYRTGSDAGKGVTGIANTITSKYQKDNGTREVLDVTAIEEQEDGVYSIPYSAAIANVTTRLLFYPESSEDNVQVIPWQWESGARTRTTSTTNTIVITDPIPSFEDLQTTVGPKRVKTKEVEIEAHDPMKLQALRERIATKPTRFGQFGGTYVRPKYSDCPCEDPRTDYE